MIKKLQLTLNVIWAFFAVTLGAIIGAVYGWTHHGLIAAVALGLVGLCVGAAVGFTPPQAMPESGVMMGWLRILQPIGSWIVGVGLLVFMAWVGWSNLYRWYTTGELLASFRGDRGRYSKLITLEGDPLNFVGLFAVDVIMAAVGSAFLVLLVLRVRKWWINKPKRTAEQGDSGMS